MTERFITYSVEPTTDLSPSGVADALAQGLTSMKPSLDSFAGQAMLLLRVPAETAELVAEAASRNGVALRRVSGDGEFIAAAEVPGAPRDGWTRTFKFSDELIAQALLDWGPVGQLKIERGVDGYELIFRRVDG